MGFMTEISILNDAWHKIKNNPDEFIEAIQEGMNSGHRQSHRIENYFYPVTTYPSHHADEFRLYTAYQNSFIQLDRYSVEREFGHREDLKFLETLVKEAQRDLTELKKYLKERKK